MLTRRKTVESDVAADYRGGRNRQGCWSLSQRQSVVLYYLKEMIGEEAVNRPGAK